MNLLTTQIQSIVRALHKQLREKSVKTRQVDTVSFLFGALGVGNGWGWLIYGVDRANHFLQSNISLIKSGKTGKMRFLLHKNHYLFDEMNAQLYNFNIYA